MTLKEIVERLRIIEDTESWCLTCDRPRDDPHVKGPLRNLILDLEREFLKRGEL